jgi:hypothetical protein
MTVAHDQRLFVCPHGGFIFKFPARQPSFITSMESMIRRWTILLFEILFSKVPFSATESVSTHRLRKANMQDLLGYRNRGALMNFPYKFSGNVIYMKALLLFALQSVILLCVSRTQNDRVLEMMNKNSFSSNMVI